MKITERSNELSFVERIESLNSQKTSKIFLHITVIVITISSCKCVLWERQTKRSKHVTSHSMKILVIQYDKIFLLLFILNWVSLYGNRKLLPLTSSLSFPSSDLTFVFIFSLFSTTKYNKLSNITSFNFKNNFPSTPSTKNVLILLSFARKFVRSLMVAEEKGKEDQTKRYKIRNYFSPFKRELSVYENVECTAFKWCD